MTPTEIIANMAYDFANGFWVGTTMPAEMIAEFQGVRPNRVTITRSGEVFIGREQLTRPRLEKFVRWLEHEYPWVVEMNVAWTLPAATGKGVAA